MGHPRLRAMVPYAWAALSGLLYFLASPPLQWAPLGWVALVPLVIAVRKTGSWRGALLCGMVAATVLSAFGLAWMADMAHRFWNVPWPVAGLLLLVYSTFGEINFTLFAVAAGLLRRRLPVWPAAVSATLFATIEWATPKVFPDALGYTQIDVPPVAAASALVGTHGLTFVIAWFAACLAWYPFQEGIRRSVRRAELLLCVAVIAGLATYGALHRRAVDRREVKRQLEVVIIQNNVGDAGVFLDDAGDMERMADTVIAKNAALTRRAMLEGPADLYVWPETSIPCSPRDLPFESVRSLARILGAPLILGGYDFQPTPERTWIYNALFWMDTDGVVRDRYYKHKLLPLGEHVPFSEQFPVLRDWIPNAGLFSPGPGPRAMQVDGLSITPFICYEVLFPGYVRRVVNQGGDLLVNLTNDYWFGKYAEPQQHLALARMRAYETGRPIIRATNTGISAVIDANARVRARTSLWQPEILRATLDVPAAPTTPYLRWGEWLFLALMGFAWATTTILWKLVR